MVKSLVRAVGLIVLTAASAQAQQEPCKMEMGVPALTLADMYAKAARIAGDWHADAVPTRVTNTNLGPLDEKGRSAAWNLNFYSASAGSLLTVSTFRGMFSCSAMQSDPGRIPALAPDFFRDGAKLYAIAKEKGGAWIAKGYAVSVGTAAAPETRHATWYINFDGPDNRRANLSIILDANTGALEKVVVHD
jgi:hypothetical protein